MAQASPIRDCHTAQRRIPRLRVSPPRPEDGTGIPMAENRVANTDSPSMSVPIMTAVADLCGSDKVNSSLLNTAEVATLALGTPNPNPNPNPDPDLDRNRNRNRNPNPNPTEATKPTPQTCNR